VIWGFKGDGVQKFRDYLWLFLISGFIVVLDQYTKWLVRSNLSFAESWLPEQLQSLLPYMRIVYWHNTGAAFGLFQNGNLIFIILGFIVSGVIIYYYPHVSREDWWLKLALGLQLGGALGNLIDRLQYGHVTDFISVGSFPVFNVADSAITVGTCILLLGVYLKERKIDQQAKTAQDLDQSSTVNTQKEASKGE
jgi:signal peptidase II